MVCVNSVTVNPKQKTMNVGEWCYDLSASMTPTNATCQCVTWHSSNTEVATVNPTSGYVYAKKKGTVNIYATATDGSGESDYCTVTVEERILVQSLIMQPVEVTMPVGATDTLEAHLWPENATDKRVCWESCNPCIASVDENGVVTANSVGETQVYAMTLDGSECCDYCTVIVLPVEVESITVSPTEKNLIVGEQVQLIPTVSPANATNPTVRWSSSAPGVATVDESSGRVVAKSTGTVNIYATACDGSGVYGCCAVTVNAPVAVGLVTLYPKAVTVAVGESVQLSPIFSPNNATNKSVFWSSSANGVATVNGGIVTGVLDGTATITVRTADGDKTDECMVVVDSRAKVIVEKDYLTGYNRILLPNGKVWNYVGVDVINEYTLNTRDDPFSRWFYKNVYETVVEDGGLYYYDHPKVYTDEEIKLLYTLDPYGLAGYVKEYASLLFREGEDVQDSLKRMLDCKDNIFQLLFNRQPKYYARNSNGVWYETSDTSNLLAVMSESEFLFGQHPVYDIVTLRELISVVIDIVSMVIQCPAIKSINIISKAAKVIGYYSLARSVAVSALNGDFNGFVSAIADGIVDEDTLDEDFITPTNYKSKNYTLSWASDLLSFSSDLGALAATFANGPHFYKEVFTKCINDLDYNILIRTTDNKLISISDINNVI